MHVAVVMSLLVLSTISVARQSDWKVSQPDGHPAWHIVGMLLGPEKLSRSPYNEYAMPLWSAEYRKPLVKELGCYVQVTFAYAAGPLAWSVVAFRNSLVFHSLDKVFHLSCSTHAL